MKKVLVVGGANGIGLAIATELAQRDDVCTVYVVDKAPIPDDCQQEKFEYQQCDLATADYSLFDKFSDIDTLVITAGFGRVALFRDVTEQYIMDSFQVNTLSAMRLIKRFYAKLEGNADFRCCVMVSIAGFMSSPYLSVYAATKAALKVFIESVNVELTKAGTSNRILNVSPGSIKGTSFSKGKTDLSQLKELTQQIVEALERKDDLLIPQYEEVFKEVLERYHRDFRAEGLHSYEYKEKGGRVGK